MRRPAPSRTVLSQPWATPSAATQQLIGRRRHVLAEHRGEWGGGDVT